MNCYLCNEEPDGVVPLLRCGDYVCPSCYCRIRDHKITYCLICHKILIRGKIKNRIKKKIEL